MIEIKEVQVITKPGVIHRAFLVDGILYTAEADNLDQAEERTITSPNDKLLLPFLDTHTPIFCKRCFPKDR